MYFGSCWLKAGLAILFWIIATASTAGGAVQLNSFAFGSCNHSHLPQPMWSVINAHQPDLFLWTGDVVYADTIDTAVMREKYQQQLTQPDYQKFRFNTPVIGIWDDHDYGVNNGGKDNPIKSYGQKIFLDFLNEPENSDRRKQEGIYTSHTYGVGERSVKYILLDTRYHRDRPGMGRADILGRKQWHWLEEEIKNSTASVNFIVSGFSVLSQKMPFAEEWNDFKWPRKKLFNLIRKYKLPGVVFLTGDRHFSSHLAETVSGQEYHEFMSSGLTHYLKRKRVSQIFRFYYGTENSYFGLNFSLINIHWDRTPLQLTYRVYDTENTKRVEKTLSLVGGRWSDVS